MVEKYIVEISDTDDRYLGRIRLVRSSGRWSVAEVYLLHGEKYISFAKAKEMAVGLIPTLPR